MFFITLLQAMNITLKELLSKIQRFINHKQMMNGIEIYFI